MNINYRSNRLNTNGIIELAIFAISHSRLLRNKRKLSLSLIIFVGLFVITFGVLVLLFLERNTFNMFYSVFCILFGIYYIGTFVCTYDTYKKVNSFHTKGSLRINKDYISDKSNGRLFQFPIDEIKKVYIGKYSLFILINNSNIFFYFSIEDSKEILDALNALDKNIIVEKF